MDCKRITVIIALVILMVFSSIMVFADSPFIDIEKNWARESIINVYEKGLMNGTSADRFSPDGTVNKYSALIAIARMMNAEKEADLDALVKTHKDILEKYDVPSYAHKEIAFCHEKDVILGEIDLAKFKDSPNATKLDIAVYLGRAFGVEHDPLKPSAQLFFRDTESILRAYRIYVEHMIKIDVVDGKGDANGDFRPNDLVTRGMFAKMLDVASDEYSKEFNGTGYSRNKDEDEKDILEPSEDEYDSDIHGQDTIDEDGDIEKVTTSERGIIDSIIYKRDSKPKVVLETEDKKMVEFYIPEDLIKENIILNGQLSDIYSLRPNMQVEVKVLEGVIERISTVEITQSIDGKALIKDIDIENARILVDIIDDGDRLMGEKEINTGSAKIGDLSLNILSLDELRIGQSIMFFGIEDMEGIKASTIIVQ